MGENRTNLADSAASGKESLDVGFDAIEKRAVSRAVVATVLIGLLALVSALVSRAVWDHVLPQHATASLVALIILSAIVLFADLGFRVLRSRLVEMAAQDADARVSSAIFARLIGSTLASTPQSHLAASVWREHEAVREMQSSTSILGIADAVMGLVFVAAMLVVAPILTPIPLLIGGALIPLSLLCQRRIAAASAAQVAHGIDRQRMLLESILGVVDLKLARSEQRQVARVEAAIERTGDAVRSVREWGGVALSFSSSASLLTGLSITMAGAFCVIEGWLSMGGVIAAGILGGRIISPFVSVSGLLLKAGRAKVALENLKPVLAAVPEGRPAHQSLSDCTGSLRFEKVTFRYPGTDLDVMDCLSLNIPAGQSVAVVGPRGAGKSTLWKLATGLHEIEDDNRGVVSIDGLNVKHIARDDLRRHVGAVPQDAVLFTGTVGENVRLAKPDATDDEVRAALHLAGAEEWVRKRGLDARIVEQGRHLSGGERQALALARLFLSDPRVVFLDEPTANFDAETQAAFLQRVPAWLKGRTAVIITHRPELLALVDRVVLLRDGAIQKDGRPADFLAPARPAPAQQAPLRAVANA